MTQATRALRRAHEVDVRLAGLARDVDRFSDLTTWIAGHLTANLSVDTMAARTYLSRRHFSRVFAATYGASPAAHVAEVRLSEAIRRLSERRVTIEVVAGSVGDQSVNVFRRAFERRFGVSPTHYRSRFQVRGRSRP